MITIEGVKNGYVVKVQGATEVYKENEIELMFNRILQNLTGKADSFAGESFGQVRVNFDYALRK